MSVPRPDTEAGADQTLGRTDPRHSSIFTLAAGAEQRNSPLGGADVVGHRRHVFWLRSQRTRRSEAEPELRAGGALGSSCNEPNGSRCAMPSSAVCCAAWV